mmetsp:Transcript_16850/g.43027  ORF Transcript_16850/g.43027 Transcript_16850/m.43027 type:complete len:82 (+) Transcript_16850:113-358(+)
MGTLVAQVDFTEVEHLPVKKTVESVNNFIVKAVTFLNRLARICDSKLQKISIKIAQLEASLSLLQKRLDSVKALQVDEVVT